MRLSKIIAMSGLASRRGAEELIIDGIVKVNDKTVTDIVTFVKEGDEIIVGRQNISQWLKKDFVKSEIKLWLFNKPKAVITSRSDPQGRTTLFSLLPSELHGLISVGRLDYNTEGLILLTNNGRLARYFELPSNALKRVYRARVYGSTLSNKNLDEIRAGITVNGINYGAIDIMQDSDKWYTLTLKEGKNREIRHIFEHYGLKVTRLIRISYGEFKLSDLKPCETIEIHPTVVEQYKSKI